LNTDHQSVQSGAGKVIVTRQHCSVALALKLWNRKAPSLSSPEVEIFLPRLAKSWKADVFTEPKVLTAMGAKRYWLPMLACFPLIQGSHANDRIKIQDLFQHHKNKKNPSTHLAKLQAPEQQVVPVYENKSK